MNTNFTRWTNPILGQEAQNEYSDVYGQDGVEFLHILESSPYEIAVVSRLLAHLQKVKGGEQ